MGGCDRGRENGRCLTANRKTNNHLLKCENLSPFLLLWPAYILPLPLPKEEHLRIPSWGNKSKKPLKYDFWGSGLITLQSS